MEYIKLFEEFINESKLQEGMTLSSEPKSYAEESFWDKTFKGGITDAFVNRPKYKSVIASIVYDLGLPFFRNKQGDVYGLSYYGTNLTNAEGSEIIVKGAFDGDYTYAELKDKVAQWAKKNNIG